MSRRKTGRKLVSQSPDRELARLVSTALREDFGAMSSAVKQIAQITGAKINTVTNWYQGKNVPGARYLLLLARASPSILRFVLVQIGGELLLDAYGMFAERSPRQTSIEIGAKIEILRASNVSNNVSMAAENSLRTLLNRRQEWIITRLKAGTNISAVDVAKHWNVGIRTAWRDIDRLKSANRIQHFGSRRRGYYAIIAP